MTTGIPRSVATGRRVATALLLFATMITLFAVAWLIALWVTQPVAV